MDVREQGVVFACEGETLVGVITRGEQVAATGVVIVVGGPQYRVGSHRQFVLLARTLAAHGVACLRFDYRGMGDAGGEQRSFATVDADIDAALAAFHAAVPGLQQVVLWGLCDGASAICLRLGDEDNRGAPPLPIAGAVLLNPWVRTVEGHARTMLKHYYLKRLLDRRFWKKLVSGQFAAGRSLASLFTLLSGKATTPAASAKEAAGNAPGSASMPVHLIPVPRLPERMRLGLEKSGAKFAVFLSGRDFVAREFEQMAEREVGWVRLLASVRSSVQHFPEADHTFSRRTQAAAIEDATLSWLRAQGWLD